MLPPQSLRHDVRRSNASNIRAIARLYSMLLSTWLSDMETDVNEEDSSSSSSSSDDDSADGDSVNKPLPYAKWRPIFHHRMMEVATRVQQLSIQTETAKWEGSIRGKWPHKKYERLVEIQAAMLNNLAQVNPFPPIRTTRLGYNMFDYSSQRRLSNSTRDGAGPYSTRLLS